VREENLASMKEQLERDPAVESVDYNYVRHLSNAPNDPRFDEQWGMTKPRFEDVRSRTRRRGIRIAVVDTGAATNHPDLKHKIALQRDFRHNDGTVEDSADHGTHVAGTVAAETNNRTGVAGGCESTPVKEGMLYGVAKRRT
jgi:thermitase